MTKKKYWKILFIMIFFSLLLSGCNDPLKPGNLLHPLVTEDDSLPSLNINGTKLHLETQGNPANPPIIVLHGGPGNDYRDMLALTQSVGGYSLSDEYYFIFWDQRGSGLSERHDESELSLSLFLEDLEKLIDFFAPGKKVILLGHSWGGQYAAMYMSKHPERVSGVILAEPGPFSSDIGLKMESITRDIFSESMSDYLWSRQFFSSNDHLLADYGLGIILADPDWNKSRKDHPALNWRVGAAVLQHIYIEELTDSSFDFTKNLDLVACDVLFLVGERSSEMDLSFQSQYQMPLFNSASIVEIPDSGHTDIVGHNAEISIGYIRTYLDSLGL